jgi:hypothetical protein
MSRQAVTSPYVRRALTLWPRLDAARLARARGDPARIAMLVARRTRLPLEVIEGMLRTPIPAPGVER